MPNIKTLMRSFAGGEISPEMLGRIDDAKYQTGLALCRNFIPKIQGPVENRPGTQFVREIKDSTQSARLIPFTFSTTQTVVIEMGPGYFRFHTNGGTLMHPVAGDWAFHIPFSVGDLRKHGGITYYCTMDHVSRTFADDLADGIWYAQPASGEYEIPSPYAEQDLFDLHYVQSADVLTLVNPGYAPRELRRNGATNWELSTILFVPHLSPPSVQVTGNNKGTAYFYQYVVTAVDADGLRESVASSPAQGVVRGIDGISNANPMVINTDGNHNLAVGRSVFIENTGIPELDGNYYTVSTVVDADEITLEDAAGNIIDSTSFGTYTSGGTIVTAGVKNNLYATGGANTISWAPVSGAAYYNVYKWQGGIYGYIGQTAGSTLIDDNIDPDLGKTPPRYDAVFDGTGKYPGAVSYFEQRRCFAGTTQQPQNFLATRSGTESEMTYSLPVKDEDRISFRVSAREANTIRHIVPLSQLILLTSSAEWRVTANNSDALTPTSISVRPQSYIGASNVQPVIINNTLIYVAARGGHIRELGYNWQSNGYITGDMSLRAAHLFDYYDIVDMAYAKAPQPLVWFVSTSGKLLGLTYSPEQQIGAWHQHDTDGVFESCAVVAEGNEDVLYVIVKRTIDGVEKRYVERMASRQFDDQADAIFVDCSLTYDGAAATTISGLDHLEGKTVSILADGAVHPQRVVESGSITLEYPVEKAQIGLPITADIQTLPMAAQVDNAFGQGRYKNVNKCWLRVYRSGGVFVGPSSSKLTEAKWRESEEWGEPTGLRTEEIEILIQPSWGSDGQVFVRQSDPLPLSLLSMTAEVALGG